MTRAVVLTVCAVIQALLAVAAMAQAPVAQSKPKTITATIEAIDQANRVVTLKGPQGNSVDVKAPDQMEGFKNLKVGDQVTATYFNALAVRIRKSGEPAPAEAPATTTTRKEGTPGSETRREQTFTVTVESVDRGGSVGHGQGTGRARGHAGGERSQDARERKGRGYRGRDVLRIAPGQVRAPEEKGLTSVGPIVSQPGSVHPTFVCHGIPRAA